MFSKMSRDSEMLQAYKVSKTVALPETVIGYLKENSENDENESLAQAYTTICSFLSGTNFMWYANGPRLEVVNSKNGAKVAAWKFGSILKDMTTKVVCVAEIPVFNIDLPLLVIGLECALTGGSICIFDIITSKVLRVIQLKDKVTSVCVVNGGDGIFSTLGPLQAFDGIIAVGMAGGEVYLIDLCRQSIDDARYANSTHEIKDELDACQIMVLTSKDIEKIEFHKQRATQLGNHLAIHLNAFEKNNLPHFVLKGPSGVDRAHANKSEVIVSALHYSSQLGSVLIGYNFGAFQMWNIINMELVYTSPVYEGNVPISHFAVQEPTDDPRIFCYIWTIYSNTEPYQIGFPVAVLYALNFECKEWHDGYGYLYERFQSCVVRFQNELSLPQHATCNGKPKGGHCLRLHAFNKGRTSRNSMFESHEDALTICWAVWNIWCRDRCEHTLLSIFDLNQWYKEHLPAMPDSNKYKSYMSYVSLSDLVFEATKDNSPILDAFINETTINQFVGAQKLEEHYYPCTLAFDCNACTENNIVCIASQGQQKAFLTFIETNGPLILLKPVELFEESMMLGLTPLFAELPQVISITFQREQILSIILEQQMVGCLCKCVSIWSNGSYASAGCSMEFFLSWAWNRALLLKANTDKLCVPLFDYSSVKLDANNRRMLSNCFKQLSNLGIVYEFIHTKLNTFLPNTELVHQQWNCINLISVYLEVLQWLLNVGLLPEYHVSMCKEVEQLGSLGAPYPVDSLLEYYSERREYLQTLNKQKYNSDLSLLFIDNLIDLECGGSELHKHWKDDGGNGFYPPQSLQALLLTYLVENAELMCKHCIIFYVFLDLAMALDQERYKMVISHLIKFPAVFKLSPSIIKITQAFWQLDHGDFETAMELLLDTHIYPGDLKMWHHRIVLNALLVQKQHKFALLYLQVRRPPLTDIEDLYKAISLFVYNNLLDEAIYYQRRNSTKENELLLLRHIFEECDKNDQMKQLMRHGLTQCEEEALMKYLEEVSHPNMEEFQVIYYLQQSRYMDIFQMQGDKLPRQLGLVGQRKVNFKDGMVKTLSNFFPKISRNLINVCRQERPNLTIRSARPKPMSVMVHDMKGNAKYKSTLIHGILKSRETWADSYVNEKLTNEETPFLRTPVMTPICSATKIPIISQTLISPDVTNFLDDSEMYPSKRLRLTPRQSLGLTKSFFTVSSLTHLVRLDTPIVKRKLKKPLDSVDLKEKFNMCTPQSILKVRNLLSHSSHSVGESPMSLQSKEMSPQPASPSKALKLSPRKSLSRSIVRFEKLNDSTASSESLRRGHDGSASTLTLSGISDENMNKSSETNVTKNSSQSTEEIYYSPETSPKSTSNNTSDLSKSRSLETTQEPVTLASVVIEVESEANPISTVNLIDSLEVPKKIKKFPPTPRSRRSYRDQSLSSSSSDSIQTRSRTRLSSQNLPKDSPKPEASKKIIPSKPRTPSSTLRGRKSLSRQVLENNAYATMLSPSSTTASHTVEKHHMNVEKSSPDLKKMIAEFSKYVSDLSVKIEDCNSERTSLIHTEVQNSSVVQILEDSSNDDDSVATTDISDLNISLHSLGLPSFVYDRPTSLSSSPAGSGELQQQKVEAIKSSDLITNAHRHTNLNESAYETSVDNKEQEVEVIAENINGQSDILVLNENPLENNTGLGEEEEDIETSALSENPLENNVYLIEEQEDENLNMPDDEITPDETEPLQIPEDNAATADLNMSIKEQLQQESEAIESSGERDDLITNTEEFELNVSAAEKTNELNDENNETNTDDKEQELTVENSSEQTDILGLSENQLENNIYFVEEEEDENLIEHDRDDKPSEVRMEDDKRQGVEVTEDICENSNEQTDNSETSENPLENNVYLVEEQDDENLDVLDKTEPTREVEIVEVIEISDNSDENDSLNQSSESRGSNNTYLSEEEEGGEEEDDDEESDNESNSSANELADSRESDYKGLEEELEEHVAEENYATAPQNNIEKYVTESESIVSKPDKLEVNIEYAEATPSVTDLNLENQNQAISNSDVPKNVENADDTPTSKGSLNKTDILDQSFESRLLEITRVDILDVSAPQKAEKITTDLSDKMKTTTALEAPKLNKTDILDASTSCRLLEITSVDILDATLPPIKLQHHAGNIEAQKNEDLKSEHHQNIAATKSEPPLTTRLRKRVSSCDLESSPSTSAEGIRNFRKRSASVHEAPAKTAVEEFPSQKKKESVTILQPKRRLRSNSASDIKQPDDEVDVSSRNRRALSVSSEPQPTIVGKRNRRAKSIQNMPTIDEDGDIQKLKQNKQGPSADPFEEYSTSRRLTRSQKSLLKRSSKDMVEAASSSLKSLEKSTLEDKIDLDEMALENSSQSSITEGSVGGKLRKRKQSQDSASSIVSTVASASDVGTPKRKGRVRRPSTESVASSDRQLRSSSSPSVNKANQKLLAETDSENSPDLRRSTRTRLKSGTSEISSDSDSVVSRKSARRRLVNTELNLSQIPEENNGSTSKEMKDESEVKKGRKRKTSTKK